MKINELDKDSVCAVVVTYNRKELLIECLEALKNQTRPLQGIYKIDNASTDGTPELLLEKKYIKELPPKNLSEPWEKEFEIKNSVNKEPIQIHYVKMNENTGGVGGFHEGVKRGYKKGYDWLWLMDDDAEPYLDSLEKLLDKLPNKEISAIVCNIQNNEKTFSLKERGYFQKKEIIEPVKPSDKKNKNYIYIDIATFVGFLLNSKVVVEKAGFPYKEFFIWYDDVEYSLRVREYGKILFKLDSIIKHKYNMDIPLTVKEIYKFRFFIWNIKIYWKFLCGLRNKKYIYKKYSNRFYLILFLIKQIFQLIISDYKKLRLKYFFKFLKQENLSDFKTIKPNEWQEILKKYRIK